MLLRLDSQRSCPQLGTVDADAAAMASALPPWNAAAQPGLPVQLLIGKLDEVQVIGAVHLIDDRFDLSLNLETVVVGIRDQDHHAVERAIGSTLQRQAFAQLEGIAGEGLQMVDARVRRPCPAITGATDCTDLVGSLCLRDRQQIPGGMQRVVQIIEGLAQLLP
ncbi:hypothetical protein ASE08_09355 [Rhizobacter sp. Root16D2]|nr:hypothetical protein ASE08_09355 [Rhizobacter sp. Root16D2]